MLSQFKPLMRKIITLFFLFAFSAMQYGKLLSWLYCELRVEITSQKAVHCDCEKKLIGANDKLPPASTPHSHSKEKLNEPYTAELKETKFVPSILITSCFGFSLNDLQRGFSDPPYHPPAMVC